MKTSLIGALFIAALAIVLYLGITLSGAGSLGEMFGEDPQEVKVVFDQVTGLKVRDEVTVSGINVGRVQSMELLDNGKVSVVCRVDRDAKLFKSASAEIISIGALGGRFISIQPGDPASGAFENNAVISGEYVQDFLVAAGRAMENVDSLLTEASNVMRDIGLVVTDLREGRGVLGAAINDTEIRDDVKNLLSNLNESSTSIRTASEGLRDMISEVNNGRGALHEAIYNEETGRNLSAAVSDGKEMLENLKESSKDVREVTAKINEGDGVIPTLLNDQEMAANAKRLVDSAAKAADDVSETFVEARELVSGVNRGRGTVGKLFSDDALYNDILRMVNTLQASFEDLREQAPVTTFASVIFQVFQ